MSRTTSDRRPRVLVVGGYGAVGCEVSRALAEDRERIELIVAGRSADKARALAEPLGVGWRAVDADAPRDALADVDAIINCVIDATRPSLALAEAAADHGRFYLDVAGVPLAYLDRVLALDARAKASGATLVTGLGCNPGIPGLLALSNATALESVAAIDFHFCLGSRMAGVSALSMQGMGDLIHAKAQVWDGAAWVPPRAKSEKRLVAAYGRRSYFGPAYITRDLRDVPARLGLAHFAFWSGIEETWQGMLMLLGLRLGRTKTPARAERFVAWLRRRASTRAHDDAVLEMTARGQLAGAPVVRRVALSADERFMTAIAPVLVLRHWLAGEITAAGAFVAPDVVPAPAFVEALRRAPVAYTESITPMAPPPR